MFRIKFDKIHFFYFVNGLGDNKTFQQKTTRMIDFDRLTIKIVLGPRQISFIASTQLDYPPLSSLRDITNWRSPKSSDLSPLM